MQRKFSGIVKFPSKHKGFRKLFVEFNCKVAHLAVVITINSNNCSFTSAGKAAGVLYEDDGDGYEFTQGGYLLSYYVAELQSSVVTVKVSKTEGSWTRPNRRIHVNLLLGGGAKV